MIEIKNISFRYENSESSVLNDISTKIYDGEVVLICGESGCGKTSVTRLINGLIPHYYEGTMVGEVTVNNLDVSRSELYETAKLVGSVFQNPRSQFFCVDTTSGIAFGCENMGLPENEVRKRIKKVANEQNINHLLERSIFNLSGGEKQKVACASVSAVYPSVLVLDEPTSNLDIHAIYNLREIVHEWKRQGKTVIISEHRIHWLLDICDRVIYMQAGAIQMDCPMEEFSRLKPETIQKMGLRPLTLNYHQYIKKTSRLQDTIDFHNFRYSYKEKNNALNISNLSLPRNGIIAVIGHNGAGKSTFSKCLCGLERKFNGSVTLNGLKIKKQKLLKKCYMVMQDVNHQLFCESVLEEVRLGMSEENKDKVEEVLTMLDLTAVAERHPMSLSGGQKQRVAIASALLADKELLIFDEPTSGLGYRHMKETAELLLNLKGKRSIFIVTHDPDLISSCCTHILHLENGCVKESYPFDEIGEQRLEIYFDEIKKEVTIL
ncbi:ABC transporter ATP-binding protein [Anaerovorax sp. IOR16]|uniref:ABC transporter ATP-binding protein n=1 Tax=Anaerovorax sp. IOR16 TaxID=2773458 RepID=UPI0019D1C0AB|nr:ABC transporter ATP-binding protein [Anaerovorax sp. IOR16]